MVSGAENRTGVFPSSGIFPRDCRSCIAGEIRKARQKSAAFIIYWIHTTFSQWYKWITHQFKAGTLILFEPTPWHIWYNSSLMAGVYSGIYPGGEGLHFYKRVGRGAQHPFGHENSWIHRFHWSRGGLIPLTPSSCIPLKTIYIEAIYIKITSVSRNSNLYFWNKYFH